MCSVDQACFEMFKFLSYDCHWKTTKLLKLVDIMNIIAPPTPTLKLTHAFRKELWTLKWVQKCRWMLTWLDLCLALFRSQKSTLLRSYKRSACIIAWRLLLNVTGHISRATRSILLHFFRKEREMSTLIIASNRMVEVWPECCEWLPRNWSMNCSNS